MALVNLDRTAQVAYIEAHPALRFLHCHCTLVKVASVAIHEDGTFDATFVRPFAAAGCTQRLVYVVRQATPSGERVIYDGRTGPVSFGFGEEADLKVSWLARTCSRDDLGTDVGVYLNRIGATSADHLVRSVDQDGELSFAPLAAGDGLVNGGANVWGGTLALRYSFHQNLKGLGAVYYRVRIQQVDDLGDPVGAPVDHSTPVAWGLKQGTQIVQTALGPKPAVATVNNLYTIPFYADGWDFDANSFHALIDTTALVDNGRYLFGVDIFDQNGARLVPADSGATGAGEAAKAFVYQRMNPSADPAVVNLTGVAQKALANLFRVDNTAAVAAFSGLQQIRAGSVVNDVLTGCQYLAGLPTDELRIRYRAHHDAGWLDAVSINVTEGIGGPTTASPLRHGRHRGRTCDGAHPVDDAGRPARHRCQMLVRQHHAGDDEAHQRLRWAQQPVGLRDRRLRPRTDCALTRALHRPSAGRWTGPGAGRRTLVLHRGRPQQRPDHRTSDANGHRRAARDRHRPQALAATYAHRDSGDVRTLN